MTSISRTKTERPSSPVPTPDDDQALFFIQVDRMTGIDDIDGAGVVEPSGTADIYWLIVPAPGASNGNPQGDLYYVGASMRYAMADDEQDFEISRTLFS